MMLLALVMLRIHMHHGWWKYVLTVVVMPSYARSIMVMLDLHHSAIR